MTKNRHSSAPQDPSASGLNNHLNYLKEKYNAAKEKGVKGSLQQEAKQWFWSAFSELTKYCNTQGIECEWLRDAFIAEFKKELDFLVPAISSDHMMQFITTLIKYGSTKEQAYQAVSSWTGYTVSRTKNYHRKWERNLAKDIESLQDQEDYKAHLLGISAFVIDCSEMKDMAFPEKHAKAFSAYSKIKRNIRERNISSPLPLDAPTQFKKPPKKK